MKEKSVRRRISLDRLFKALVITLSFIIILPMFFILYFIIRNGISVINWGFLVSLPKPMGEAGGGISNALVGTTILIVTASIISIPFGILIGIYLSEYKRGRFPYFSRLSLEILQGIPSIVIGIIAYVWIVVPMGSFSALSGGIALAIMMLPVIVMSTEETLKLIPDTLREASLALRGPLPPYHPQGGAAGRLERHSDRHHPGHSKDRRRNGSAPLHRLRQPLHEHQHIQACQLAAAPCLQLRHEPLPGVARPGMGGLLRPDRLYPVLESHCESGDQEMESTVLKTEDFGASFEDNEVVRHIDLSIERNKITAIMGPSGCGKTTFIRCINRMHELVPGATSSGRILLDGENIYDVDAIIVRRKIGMVFQRPNPFPTMSIYDNVVAGYNLNGIGVSKTDKDRIVEESLQKAALWAEVKNALHRKGTFLSGGQQQRLCIARALAMYPEILLLDEPTSALDPKATAHIEELVVELKATVTIIQVTHNIPQAARISDFTAFLYLGELVEFGPTEKLFTVPKDKRTEQYLTGKFG